MKPNKKLPMQGVRGSDDFQTPEEGIQILEPYINKQWTIWECASGKGNIVNYLKKQGFKVVNSDKELDFLKNTKECDCIITNPPYTLKEEFLKRCYELKKPFALLLPLSALEGKKRGELYRTHGIQLLIPNKRINFETPTGISSSAWFQTAGFCHGFNLPKDLNFIDVR